MQDAHRSTKEEGMLIVGGGEGFTDSFRDRVGGALIAG